MRLFEKSTFGWHVANVVKLLANTCHEELTRFGAVSERIDRANKDSDTLVKEFFDGCETDVIDLMHNIEPCQLALRLLCVNDVVEASIAVQKVYGAYRDQHALELTVIGPNSGDIETLKDENKRLREKLQLSQKNISRTLPIDPSIVREHFPGSLVYENRGANLSTESDEAEGGTESRTPFQFQK